MSRSEAVMSSDLWFGITGAHHQPKTLRARTFATDASRALLARERSSNQINSLSTGRAAQGGDSRPNRTSLSAGKPEYANIHANWGVICRIPGKNPVALIVSDSPCGY
jgi:hypothetical protein